MTASEDEPNRIALAYGWLARMTTVVLEMLLPGLGGQWLDSRWGTNYWVFLGFGLGFVVGLVHLLQMVKQYGPAPPKNNSDHPPPDNTESE